MLDRTLRFALLAAATTVLVLGLADPALARNAEVSIDSSGSEQGCAGLRVRFDGETAVKAEQSLSVPGGTPLRLHAPDSSALRVTGWDRTDFEITACKAARDAATLSRISVSAPKGVVSVSGVVEDEAVVYFYVKAPKGAVLDLAAENGPMTLRDLDGTVTARLENGPLSLSGVHGAVDVEATNGPVSFKDGSGDWTVRVTNGPLSAHFAGTRWEGKGLVAETVNGPLTVSLDPRFASGLRVSAASHTPFRCRAAACSGARRTFGGEDGDGDRSVEIGAGEPVVRLSTVNGPVTIRDDASGAD
ncbi:MAG: hypothetical protein IPP07_09110 [Holophagales bacterium]|nr:hypothetical protein [Holophagales bacterium]MBK9965029.1 hypothetical protein [Holophagales bacterium]